MSEKRKENKLKPPDLKEKGFDQEHYDYIKDKIKKRVIVSCRLTEDEFELWTKHLVKNQVTSNKQIRELIKKEIDEAK